MMKDGNFGARRKRKGGPNGPPPFILQPSSAVTQPDDYQK